MQTFNTVLVRLERLFHPKIKEGIAKSLVYFFTLKEVFEFQKVKYRQPHVYEAFENILNIAHRGFSAQYPENTLLAFEKAMAEQAHMLELDVQLSRDGKVVVCHDPNLMRLTGQNKFIADLDYAHLKELDLGQWFQDRFAGLSMPTLSDVFDILDDNTLVNIEIKHEATSFIHRDAEKAVLEVVAAHQMQSRVVISAFNPMIVNRIRKLAPEISTAYLITQTLTPPLIALLARINARYIHVDIRYLSPQKVQRLHRAGVQVLVYTLNDHQGYQQALEWGLKGIFTDVPDQLRQFLQ